MDVVVAGASGFIGQRVVPALVAAGHTVRALSRHAEVDGEPTPAAGSEPAAGSKPAAESEPTAGSVRQVRGDVSDAASLKGPFDGADVLIYLVHSLGDDDFERRDAEAAWDVAQAAGEAGIKRIVYLGGLGADGDSLSTHLRSRREVEGLLGHTGIPVTVLRAGIVIGHGSISWEITRQLVSHLPAMVAPRWVATRCQPIGIEDVVAYLVGVLDKPESAGVTYDIGGPDILSYKQMLDRTATVMGRRRRPIVPLPLLTPRLSSYWLQFVTDVDKSTASSLVMSMTNEVIVRDDSITRLIPRQLLAFDDAVRHALADRAAAGLKEAAGAST